MCHSGLRSMEILEITPSGPSKGTEVLVRGGSSGTRSKLKTKEPRTSPQPTRHLFAVSQAHGLVSEVCVGCQLPFSPCQGTTVYCPTVHHHMEDPQKQSKFMHPALMSNTMCHSLAGTATSFPSLPCPRVTHMLHTCPRGVASQPRLPRGWTGPVPLTSQASAQPPL